MRYNTLISLDALTLAACGSDNRPSASGEGKFALTGCNDKDQN